MEVKLFSRPGDSPGATAERRARDSFSMKTSAPGEFEVLPPERRGVGGAGSQALSQLIAYLMDNVFKVPGTRQTRVGLNPVLDLIPFGVGDTAAALVQAFTIIEAARRRVPKVVLMRMSLNVLLNGLMGVIPGVGEGVSFWYRPSSRNYNLLLKHAPLGGSSAAPAPRNTLGDWAFVFALLAVMLVFVGAFIALGFYVLAAIWHAVFH